MLVELKKRALHRTKILQGQMRGIEKMIDGDEYCMDIMTQSLAAQKSLASLNKLILENHLKTHVKEKFGTGDEALQDESIKELLDLYELTNLRTNNR